MLLVKILKRKDAAAVIVAIVIGMTVLQFLQTLVAKPAGQLAGLKDGQYISYAFPGGGWKAQYLQPVLQVVLTIIALEVLAWIYVGFGGAMKSSSKK